MNSLCTRVGMRILCGQFSSTDTSNFRQHSLQFLPVVLTENIWIEAIKGWTSSFGIDIRLISCTIRSNRKFPLSSWTDIEECITLGYDDGRRPIIRQFCKTANFLLYDIIIHCSIQWSWMYRMDVSWKEKYVYGVSDWFDVSLVEWGKLWVAWRCDVSTKKHRVKEKMPSASKVLFPGQEVCPKYFEWHPVATDRLSAGHRVSNFKNDP